jgi:hypothetical protein
MPPLQCRSFTHIRRRNGYEFATHYKKSKVASQFGSVNSVQALKNVTILPESALHLC